MQAQSDAFVAEIDACTQSLHATQQEATRHVQQTAMVSAELEAEQQQARMADQRCAEIQETKAKCEQRIAALAAEVKVSSRPGLVCVL